MGVIERVVLVAGDRPLSLAAVAALGMFIWRLRVGCRLIATTV
jgi:hypothetical protein